MQMPPKVLIARDFSRNSAVHPFYPQCSSYYKKCGVSPPAAGEGGGCPLKEMHILRGNDIMTELLIIFPRESDLKSKICILCFYILLISTPNSTQFLSSIQANVGQVHRCSNLILSYFSSS